jgi:hypothetical protein
VAQFHHLSRKSILSQELIFSIAWVPRASKVTLLY